jgi:hypothetical protein
VVVVGGLDDSLDLLLKLSLATYGEKSGLRAKTDLLFILQLQKSN